LYAGGLERPGLQLSHGFGVFSNQQPENRHGHRKARLLWLLFPACPSRDVKMLFANVRASKEQLHQLDHSVIFLERRRLRPTGPDVYEVPAVLRPDEAARLESAGFDITIQGDAQKLLKERLRPSRSRAASRASSSADLYNSVSTLDGYMVPEYITAWTQNLPILFPALASSIVVPYATWESRSSAAVQLGSGSGAHRPSILFTAGVHAAELPGADASVYFVFRLIGAYNSNSAIKLGDQSFSAAAVRAIVENLDICVFPCVNPDGRAYIFNSQDWWRKNRNPNVGGDAIGVDINRNFDFLWASGIGSGLVPDDNFYRGPAAFSEPETRNVLAVIDAIDPDYFMDIHGPAGSLATTWGDAPNQSTDPTMNFLNPLWNDRRTPPPYGEYLSVADSAFIRQLGTRVVSAMNGLGGNKYDLEQSYSDVYPTSATSDDYTFSRHLADPKASKTYAYTLEYGGAEYFPVYAYLLKLIDEINAGMLQFCLAALPPGAVQAI
jgi:murein tripeptide amidase MpaA